MAAFIRMTSYVRAGEALERHAAVFPPRRPSRRASAPLSRYDRLDPSAQPEPSPGPAQGGPRARVDGMDRLRASLADLERRMKNAGFVVRDPSCRSSTFMGMEITDDPSVPDGMIMGVDPSRGPDAVVFASVDDQGCLSLENPSSGDFMRAVAAMREAGRR